MWYQYPKTSHPYQGINQGKPPTNSTASKLIDNYKLHLFPNDKMDEVSIWNIPIETNCDKNIRVNDQHLNIYSI